MRSAADDAMLETVTLSCVIVDDNVEFLEAARNLLERDGIRVVGVATNSDEALEQVVRTRPTVTLVDVYLGDESGLDLARSLTEHPDGSDVILISTYGESDLAEVAEATPAIAFLSKSRLSGRAIQDALARSA
jgi:DNA-binding NarL/FixJ family response regulator